MSSSIPIHIYLTTSINIQLTHGSSYNRRKYKIPQKRPGLSEKLSENVFWLPYQIPSNPKKILIGIPINCLLTEAIMKALIMQGDFRSCESPQTLPALFIGSFEHVERFRNLIFAVKGSQTFRVLI